MLAATRPELPATHDLRAVRRALTRWRQPRSAWGLGFAALLLAFGAQALESGASAPDCLRTADSHGAKRLEDYAGRVLMVDFWASWCPPCRRAMPFLDELYRDYASHGLSVLAIGVDEDLADANRFLDEHPVSYATTVDVDGLCPHAFDVQAMPSTYVFDRSGKLRYVHHGFRNGDRPALRERVLTLLDE